MLSLLSFHARGFCSIKLMLNPHDAVADIDRDYRTGDA